MDMDSIFTSYTARTVVSILLKIKEITNTPLEENIKQITEVDYQFLGDALGYHKIGFFDAELAVAKTDLGFDLVFGDLQVVRCGGPRCRLNLLVSLLDVPGVGDPMLSVRKMGRDLYRQNGTPMFEIWHQDFEFLKLAVNKLNDSNYSAALYGYEN